MNSKKIIIIGEHSPVTSRSLDKILKEKGLTFGDIIFIDPNDKEKLKEIADAQEFENPFDNSEKFLITDELKEFRKETDLLDSKFYKKEPKHPFNKFMKKGFKKR